MCDVVLVVGMCCIWCMCSVVVCMVVCILWWLVSVVCGIMYCECAMYMVNNVCVCAVWDSANVY